MGTQTTSGLVSAAMGFSNEGLDTLGPTSSTQSRVRLSGVAKQGTTSTSLDAGDIVAAVTHDGTSVVLAGPSFSEARSLAQEVQEPVGELINPDPPAFPKAPSALEQMVSSSPPQEVAAHKNKPSPQAERAEKEQTPAPKVEPRAPQKESSGPPADPAELSTEKAEAATPKALTSDPKAGSSSPTSEHPTPKSEAATLEPPIPKSEALAPKALTPDPKAGPSSPKSEPP